MTPTPTEGSAAYIKDSQLLSRFDLLFFMCSLAAEQKLVGVEGGASCWRCRLRGPHLETKAECGCKLLTTYCILWTLRSFTTGKGCRPFSRLIVLVTCLFS